MRALLALFVLSLLTSCVAAPQVRPVRPPAVALPAPSPPPAPAADWRDWPQTAGDWRYGAVAGGTAATFGGVTPLFAMRCAGGQVMLERAGAPLTAMTVRTSALTRTLASPVLAAGDPLLDAMGFSRGRFVVEQPGLPPLVLPAWAEVERVVQDCRGG